MFSALGQAFTTPVSSTSSPAPSHASPPSGVARSVAASLARLAGDARRVLLLLAQSGGSATRFELISRTALDSDRCGKALAQLGAAGLIATERCLLNNGLIRLTPRGRRATRACG